MAKVPSRSVLLRMPPIVLYTAGVALDKGFSLLTIPLVAAYLSPAEFGRLDVALSLIELIGLVMAFGLADTMVRFASDSSNLDERRRCAAEFLGLSLILTAVATVMLQFILPFVAIWLGIDVALTALRVAVGGATMTSLIEMPLVWQRMIGRANIFLCYLLIRSLAQVVMMFFVLRAGFGAEGLLVANGAVMIVYGAMLAVWQAATTGIGLSRRCARDVCRYGIPLVGAALATFVLGNCNRWFLVGRVDAAEIAYLGLAFKFALIVPLLLQPYYLWWNPQRLEVLAAPGGLARSAWAWGVGVSVLLLSATALALGGPIFVSVAFPPAYAPAAPLIGIAISVCVLNELCTMSNAGAFARSNSLSILAISMAGGLVAVVAYLVLIPMHAVLGALASMMLGHATRLVLFFATSRPRIPFPAKRAVVVAAVALILVEFAPSVAQVLPRILWSTLAILILAALVVSLGLVPHPHLPQLAKFRRRLNASGR